MLQKKIGYLTVIIRDIEKIYDNIYNKEGIKGFYCNGAVIHKGGMRSVGLWNRNGRSGHKNKVLKSQPGWRGVNQVRRLRILMTVVAVVILISLIAGLLLVWYQLHPSLEKELFESSSATEYSEPVQSAAASNAPDLLLLVTSERGLMQNTVPDLTEVDGVSVDKRLAAAFQPMKEAAVGDGVTLKITKGYVAPEKQEELYKKKVQELVASGYTQVRAEDSAQTLVERGNFSEYQTGLAVDFDFTGGEQSKWLLVHGTQYGFILRYPENKSSVTQKSGEPQHFRYVGQENAQRMRQMGFCLEEYVSYLAKQSKK